MRSSERKAELAAFGQCGIVDSVTGVRPDRCSRRVGGKVKMPLLEGPDGNSRQLLSDSAPLTVNKITADQDIARIHNDAQVWSVNHLAKVISGDDPMQAIVDLVAGATGPALTKD